MYVSLGMYPFEPLRPAWEALWDAVQRRVPSLPAQLRWDVAAHEAWPDPACAVKHACGWPVATALRDVVDVVGAFAYTVDGAEGHRYRSVIVSPSSTPLAARPLADTTAAASSDDSLSGWISLGVVAGADDRRWPGSVVWSEAHAESLRMLADGDADVASVDAVSWALLRRIDPPLVAGLHVIGRGPLVPSLPIVVPASTPATVVEALRQAFVEALADASTRATREALLLDGFVPLDHHDYAALLTLTTAR